MASKPLYIVVAAVGIAAASGAAWWYQNKPAARPDAVAAGNGGAAVPASSAGPARPPAVEVARVEVVRLSDEAQAVGTLRSRQSVVLRPEVSGRVVRLNFRDGDRVRRGQLLVQLDDNLPRAQVQQAQAELSIAQANHKRNQELVAQNFISQRSVDESGAALQVAQAKLALARATADRLRIVAPFDGIAGIRSVNVGDYLRDGTDIVNIEDLDTLYVDFRLPERFQTKVRRGQTALVAMDALPDRQYSAVVQAIDPLVDANGRSVGIRGCIDNRHLQLRPGMFARITAVFGERDNARLVPEEALVPQGTRQFVYKLVDGPDQDTRIARRVEVKVGLRQPGRVEITEGLQPGEVVVVAGQQRIQRDGMPVRVAEMPRNGGATPVAAVLPSRAAGAQAEVPRPAGPNPCAQAPSR
ncbi:efflux RND transporter periplasmic adaptor subunit [Ramlibacter tataouinensis]|uniref:Candidate periplasmic linker protein n=1 Tax=Ramlibacter tataouinensis (strain ATCC BAA-407 / DSM 14655 / LMG 21543 / TTB310) TaxID=365046 RepID=F5Y0L2_RAMTT|nr:efflux RND transporter periplasmic adaptor subunit [Ramlibacter tataouinensis]AEG93418.1 Candidate periplasmic linker protein [Ramlibacter tataouinensis TTB310]